MPTKLNNIKLTFTNMARRQVSVTRQVLAGFGPLAVPESSLKSKAEMSVCCTRTSDFKQSSGFLESADTVSGFESFFFFTDFLFCLTATIIC